MVRSFLLMTALLAVGCVGWSKPTCAAIDAAHSACAVVRYVGDDGVEREIVMSRDEIVAAAHAARASRSNRK